MNSTPHNDGTQGASDEETLRAFNEIMARWDAPVPDRPATDSPSAELTRPGDGQASAANRPDASEPRGAERAGRSVAEMRRLQAERRRRAEAAAAAANLAPVRDPEGANPAAAGPRDADISYLDAMERAEALMDADPENHFVPPEPAASLKPKNLGAFAALVASVVIAVAFAFFIDSPLSGAMTALGCTMFVFVLVYLAFKAAGTQTVENSDEGTV